MKSRKARKADGSCVNSLPNGSKRRFNASRPCIPACTRNVRLSALNTFRQILRLGARGRLHQTSECNSARKKTESAWFLVRPSIGNDITSQGKAWSSGAPPAPGAGVGSEMRCLLLHRSEKGRLQLPQA